MTLEQLECHLIELQHKKMETRGVLRKLIQMHCRLGNLERANELLTVFNKARYQISPGMKAGFIDLYIKNNDLNRAIEMYNEIKKDNPLFLVDDFKIINLANLFVINNRFDEAVTLLKKQTNKIKVDKTIEANCWRLLDSSALNGNYMQTKTLFNLLTSLRFCEINNVILGPLVRVHLNK